jgi:hypothetical protein
VHDPLWVCIRQTFAGELQRTGEECGFLGHQVWLARQPQAPEIYC